MVVGDDGAFDGQAGPLRQADVGPDAGGDHQHVAVQQRAVGEGDAGEPTVADDHLGRAFLGVHPDSQGFQGLAQNRAGRIVELSVHQGRTRVHDVDGESPTLQSPCRFEAKEAAADDDGLGAVCGFGDHRRGVVEGPEAEDSVGQSLVVGPQSGHRREERTASGGEDQLVVTQRGPVVGVHQMRVGVDANDADPGAEVDVVVGVPVQRVEVDLGRIIESGKHVRQQNPVVVAIRFVAEDSDLESLGTGSAGLSCEDLLDGADSGHPVADHHQALHQTSTSPRSMTTVPRTPSGAAT